MPRHLEFAQATHASFKIRVNDAALVAHMRHLEFAQTIHSGVGIPTPLIIRHDAWLRSLRRMRGASVAARADK